jgi:glutamine amidotransferase
MINKVGGTSQTTSDPRVIMQASKLILPGVGHFDQAMERLEEHQLISALHEAVIQKHVYILCICLGAQLATKSSEEGAMPGLGWLDGHTVRFRLGSEYRIPHMGWNDIYPTKESRLLIGMPENPRFYFVHTYHLELKEKEDILTETEYGYKFTSAFEHENIFGMQYHPEKSHKYGMCIMRNFVEL